MREKGKEWLRSLANNLSLLNPMLHRTMGNARLIFAKTKETKSVLSKWNKKVEVCLEIGIKEVADNIQSRDKDLFLFVGRFIYWKGVKLALHAFNTYHKSHKSAKLLFIGKGEMETYIRKYANENGLADCINIIPWITQDELKQYYLKSCAMIFPSLHDSSGNVVLEALSHGLPVISLNCGGPATIIGNELKELIVATDNLSVEEVTNELVQRMNMLSMDIIKHKEISDRCLSRARQMLWSQSVSNVYTLIKQSFFSK